MQSFYIYIFIYYYFNIIFLPQKVNSTSTVKSLSSWSSLSSKQFLTSTKSPKTSEIKKLELTWRDATEKEYTYHIAILNKNDRNYYRFCCSGALISASYVVTSAFCVNNVTRDIEYALVGKQELRGTKKSDAYGFKKIIYFKEYLEGDKEHDLCVLQLKDRVTFTSRIQPIPLTDIEPVSGTECTVTTWIVWPIHSSETKLISRSVVLSGRCDEPSYRSKKHVICLHIPGRNNCSSDYSSVLVCNGVLTGIGIEGPGNCTNHALFSSVFYFRSWLDDLVKGDIDKTLLTDKTFLTYKTFLPTLSFGISPKIPGRHEFPVYPERDEPHFNPERHKAAYTERDESVYPERYKSGSSLGLSLEFKLDVVYLFFFLSFAWIV